MCKLRFDDRLVWDLIAGHDELSMKNAHAAILLARTLPEAA